MEYTKEQMDEMKSKIINKYIEGGKYTIEDFRIIMKVLRSKEYGCPWDSIQTHDSIRQCLIEECYETIEAIKDKDDDNLKEELGDVLMQIVMHSEIASEEDRFEFGDVVETISRKMVRRHPKVFINNENETSGAVNENMSLWEQIKAKEKEGTREAEKGRLGRVASSLPALIRAQKVIKKSDEIHKDSASVEESIDRLKNCIFMLEKCVNNERKYSNIDKIIGESLLELTNIAYRVEENAENSLTNAVEQFINKREGDKR